MIENIRSTPIKKTNPADLRKGDNQEQISTEKVSFEKAAVALASRAIANALRPPNLHFDRPGQIGRASYEAQSIGMMEILKTNTPHETMNLLGAALSEYGPAIMESENREAIAGLKKLDTFFQNKLALMMMQQDPR